MVCIEEIAKMGWIDGFAIVAAIAAAVSAFAASCQIFADRRWRKLDRTFSHSPYRNEKFRGSIEKLKNYYKCFRDRKSSDVVTKPIPKELVPDIVLVANIWGQMAMEYNEGLLDKKIAKKLLAINFLKFYQTFENWLGDDKRLDIYTDTKRLYEKWKSS